KAQRSSDARSSLLGATKGLIELGKGAGPLAVQDQPFWTLFSKFGIPCSHIVGEDRDFPLPQRCHLCSQEVKGQCRMNRPAGTWIVGITEHVLGEHGSTSSVRFQQPVPELVGIEPLADPRNVPRVVELDMNLPPGPGR